MNEQTHLTKAGKFLEEGNHEEYFSELDLLQDHDLLGSQITEIKEEWRKLQMARRNNLMDDEQIHLALLAYHNKSLIKMTDLLDQQD